MAETEHTLRVKLLLDDTDLQNKLRNLNNQRLNISSSSLGGKGSVGDIGGLASLAAAAQMTKAFAGLGKTMPEVEKTMKKIDFSMKQQIRVTGHRNPSQMWLPEGYVSPSFRANVTRGSIANAARLRTSVLDPVSAEFAYTRALAGYTPGPSGNYQQMPLNFMASPRTIPKQIRIPKGGANIVPFARPTKAAGKGPNIDGMRQIGTFLAGQAIPYLTDTAAQYMSPGAGDATRYAGNIAGGTLTGAGMGAMIGSIVPGIGTAIGAGVGALIGGGIEAIKKSPAQEAEEEARKQRLAFAKSLDTSGYDLQNYETKTRGYTDEKIDAEIKSFEEATKRQAKVLEANTRAMKKMAEDGIAPSSEFISQLAEQEKKLQDDQSRLDILNQEKESRLGGVGQVSRNFEALSNLQRFGMSASGGANYAQDIQKNTAYILQYVKDMSRKGFSARYA